MPPVPGDIRNPFAPSLHERRLRQAPKTTCKPRTTEDGVVIQRPSTLEKDERRAKAHEHCAAKGDDNLRNPFRRR